MWNNYEILYFVINGIIKYTYNSTKCKIRGSLKTNSKRLPNTINALKYLNTNKILTSFQLRHARVDFTAEARKHHKPISARAACLSLRIHSYVLQCISKEEFSSLQNCQTDMFLTRLEWHFIC